MPLDEREQRILEEIEKSLYKEDPRFARDVQRNAPRAEDRRRVKIGVVVFFLGFLTLFAFLWTGQIIVGVVAFGVMVYGIVAIAGSLVGSLAPRRPPGPRISDRMSGGMRSLEDRLRRRYKRH